MAARDFWGEVQATDLKTPLSILREQASLLGPKTNNLLVAQVDTYTQGNTFYHRFNLVVPSLDNYTYQLFVIDHAIDLYPVSVRGALQELHDEAEFTAWLEQRLTSPETRKIVANLVAQARS